MPPTFEDGCAWIVFVIVTFKLNRRKDEWRDGQMKGNSSSIPLPQSTLLRQGTKNSFKPIFDFFFCRLFCDHYIYDSAGTWFIIFGDDPYSFWLGSKCLFHPYPFSIMWHIISISWLFVFFTLIDPIQVKYNWYQTIRLLLNSYQTLIR